jgi:molybdopterin-guanine dinucleotide biosynthesis protein A
LTVAGAILAGGGATRFGGAPKGLERVGGERIVDRLAGILNATLGAPPLLVANAADAESWNTGLRIVRDVLPGSGALSGFHAALSAAGTAVMCVAWDMPFVTAPLVAAIVEQLDVADVSIPASDGRRGVEPLCAAYGPACLGAIEARIRSGDHRAIAFHPDVEVSIIPLDRVRAFGDPDQLFFNVNTADDLTRAEELWRRASSP